MTAEFGDETRFALDLAGGDGPPAVSAIWTQSVSGGWTLVLAHGAGAGMDHPFMISVAKAMASAGADVLRFQFPYMDAGRSLPDRRAILTGTLATAYRWAAKRRRGGPLVVGGKSMGGRMASLAVASGQIDGADGVLFLGFPLHTPGKPSVERADHLDGIGVPMLFVHGDRDRLGELALIEGVLARLGGRARLHVVAGADHSFNVLKRSGRTADDAVEEIQRAGAEWVSAVLGAAIPREAK